MVVRVRNKSFLHPEAGVLEEALDYSENEGTRYQKGDCLFQRKITTHLFVTSWLRSEIIEWS